MTAVWNRAAVLGGAGLLIVGSFMTWISVDLGFASFSSTGTENIEGKLTAAAGVALVLVGLTLTAGGLLGRLSLWAGLAAALFGGVTLALEYIDVQERISQADPSQASATVGMGVWVTGAGAIAALAAVAYAIGTRLRADA